MAYFFFFPWRRKSHLFFSCSEKNRNIFLETNLAIFYWVSICLLFLILKKQNRNVWNKQNLWNNKQKNVLSKKWGHISWCFCLFCSDSLKSIKTGKINWFSFIGILFFLNCQQCLILSKKQRKHLLGFLDSFEKQIIR